jgi:hypothetical protein
VYATFHHLTDEDIARVEGEDLDMEEEPNKRVRFRVSEHSP